MTSTVREEWGLACPTCRSDEHLAISIKTWAALSAEGTDAHHDIHWWNDESSCRCEACGYASLVFSFRCHRPKTRKERKRP